MSNILNVDGLEQLKPFLNDNRILEVVVRGKNNKFNAFQKVALNDLPQNEAKKLAEKAIKMVGENNFLAQRNLQMIQQVAALQQMGLVLNGLNLAATCAGFAIMYAKLDSMSSEIKQQFNQLHNTVKQGHDVQSAFEFDKVLGDYSNMLDSRRRQQPYSEEKMRVLVDNIYNVLNLLINIFQRKIAVNEQTLIVSIFSLLSMLTISLKYFDEQYYFNNRDVLGNQEVWHSSHSKWMSVYDTLTSDWFIESLQDYAIFETQLNTPEVDIYYTELRDQIHELRQEVEDNQELTRMIDDSTILNTLRANSSREIQEAIEKGLKELFAEQDSPEALEVYYTVLKKASSI